MEKKKCLLTLGLLFSFILAFGQTYSKDLEKAAKKGDAVAQRNLGICYALGSGTKKDFKKAYKWFNLAAEQGDGGAQFCIGEMIEYRIPIKSQKKPSFLKQMAVGALVGPRSLNRVSMNSSAEYIQGDAYEWYEKAAINGWAEAQLKMAEISDNPQKWLKMAAESGDAEGQYRYGKYLYEQAKSVATTQSRTTKTSGRAITPDLKYYNEYLKHPENLGMLNGKPLSEMEWRQRVYDRYDDFPVNLPPVNTAFQSNAASAESLYDEAKLWLQKGLNQGNEECRTYLASIRQEEEAKERAAREAARQLEALRKYRHIKLEKPNSILSAIPLEVIPKIDTLTIVGFMYETDVSVLNECHNLRYLDLSKAYITLSPQKKQSIEAEQKALAGLFGLMGAVADAKYDNNEMNSLDHAYAKGFAKLVETNVVTKASDECLIPSGSFQNLEKLETVILPLTACSIGYDSFLKCTSLKNVTLPPYLRQIADGSFYGCRSLSKMDFPSSLTSIGRFYDSACNHEPTFGNTNIKTFDFSNCTFTHNKYGNTWSFNFVGCPVECLRLPKGVSGIEVKYKNENRGAQIYVPGEVKSFELCFLHRTQPEIHFKSQVPPSSRLTISMGDYTSFGLEGCKMYIPRGCTTAYYSAYGNTNKYIEE
ncbi:MAG: leucine-rich repeat protein [Bacteroidales bacterium]|nr:leucine-rich repeat protein [Bacteroidales bacterium]